MVQIMEKRRLHMLKPLFRDHKFDTVMIQSVLQGHTGEAMVDSQLNPKAARLDAGSFTILGGDPNHPAMAELIRARPIRFVTPENEQWERLIVAELPVTFARLPFTEWHAQSNYVGRLAVLAEKMPYGYGVQRLDATLCEKLPKALGNDGFFDNFASTDDFLQRGAGFCVLHGYRIVAVATSLTAAENLVDIEVETLPDYRNLGLGTAAGASLVRHCLRSRITPKWLAANEASARLAARLGFTEGDSHYMLGVADND